MNGATLLDGSSVLMQPSAPLPTPVPVAAELGENDSASSPGVVTDSAAMAASVLLCRMCMRCVASLTKLMCLTAPVPVAAFARPSFPGLTHPLENPPAQSRALPLATYARH